MLNKRFYIGVAAALAGAVLWGFSGNCIQLLVADTGLDPLAITAVRAVVAAVLLVGFCLARHRRAFAEIWRNWKACLTSVIFGLALFLSQSTYAISVENTNAGTATVLQSLATVFVMFFVCISHRRTPRALEVAGLVCALVSTWLISTQGDFRALSIPASGLFWGLVNALSVSVYLICPQRLYARWSSLVVIASGLAASAIFAVLACVAGVAVGEVQVVSAAIDASDIALLVAGIGVLGTACAFGFYLYGTSIVGSVNGSLLGTAEPASAMVIMTFWLGTTVTAADWIGLILMMAMIAAVAFGSRE